VKKLFFAVFVVAVMIAIPITGVQASPNGSRGFDCSSCHPGTPNQNPPPEANAGVDQTVRAGTVVTLDGSNSTDPNGTIASYIWKQTAGTAVTLSNPAVARPTFTAPSTGASGASITFELTVADAAGLTAKDTCIVNVTPGNRTPTANAGPDQSAVAGSTVTLTGSNSTDIDGTIASYAWTQTSGPAITLSNPAAARPTFTAPSGGTSGASLTFQLTVKDDGGLAASDTCVVNVNAAIPANKLPVANAGPDQSAVAGSTATLVGSNSTDSDGTIVSYAWKQTAGTTVTLSNPAVASPTFTAPSAGTGGTSLTFQLAVKDNGGLTATDTSVVNITAPTPVNEPPVANAGPDQSAMASSTVTLNGSNSTDSDGTIASYAWKQTAGTTVTLSNPAVASPTFTAPSAGTGGTSLTFQLTVTDNGRLTATDTCVVNITAATPVNDPPVANAGPDQSAVASSTVTLNGSNSTDSDGTIASYAWKQTAGPAVALSNASAATATFTAPPASAGATSLNFQLTVTDDGKLTATDACIVNISTAAPVSKPPVANAGPDQVVDSGGMVTLDGYNSTDSDDRIVSYLWKQTYGPAVTLQNAAAMTTIFAAPDGAESGTSLTFQLIVTDAGGHQSSDTCIININPSGGSLVNLPPVADAGPDQRVRRGARVTLDGSNSSDTDDGIVSYRWRQISGRPVTLSDSAAEAPTFRAPSDGRSGKSFGFRLTVTDEGGLRSADTCVVRIGERSSSDDEHDRDGDD
jgi:hypothetical protein